jgi:hypothetical protein
VLVNEVVGDGLQLRPQLCGLGFRIGEIGRAALQGFREEPPPITRC